MPEPGFSSCVKDENLSPSLLLSFLLFNFFKLSSFCPIRHSKKGAEMVLGDPIYDICYPNKGIKRLSTSGSTSWMCKLCHNTGPCTCFQETQGRFYILCKCKQSLQIKMNFCNCEVVHCFMC